MSMKREAAQDAARRCFSIFPVRGYVDPGENATPEQRMAAAKAAKEPLIANWQNLATQDPKQIDTWWDEWPDANIGGVTNDLVVVDIDPRNGGAETAAALLDLYEFPTTLRSATQGGGDHVFYAAPRPVKGGTNKLGKGVDVKARGGYVLLPGSTIGGCEYKWWNDRPIAPAPEWLIDQCKAVRAKTDAAGKRIVEEDDQARELFEQWMSKHAPEAHQGDVDDTTYKMAARGYDFGCSEATVFEVVSEWDSTHCFPQNDPERLPVVVESAGRNRENAIGARHPDAPGFEAVEIDESRAPKPEPKATPVEGMKLERYFAAAARALSSQAEPLIKGVLDRNAMSILYGESNTGKTFIAVDMAFHVAAGLAWAKRKVRPGAVVYVAAEGGAGVYKRLAALREKYPQVGDVPLFILKFPVDLLHGKEHAAELVRLCRAAADEAGCTLELIVIDTLSRAMSGGDENSSTDMGAMVKSFDAIREATGAHLMVIHHSGKDRAKGARGHSLLRAATDTEIEIERGKLAVTKQRDMEGDFKQSFNLPIVPIGVDADGDVVTSCVVELVSPHLAGPVEVPPTGDEAQLAAQLRDRLERTAETSFGAQFVRETYLELAWSRGDSDGAIYKVLQTLQTKRLVKKLQPGQYVMVDTPKLQTAPN